MVTDYQNNLSINKTCNLMTIHHRILFLTIFIAINAGRVFCQPTDTTLSQPITGNQLIEATNSITFQAGFSYDAGSSNQMIAMIIPTTGNTNYTFTEPRDSGALQVNTSYPVGSINGSISVGPTGAANYMIPIDIPPGRNGMKPNLSLVYSSQGGEGLLGLGWALTGLSGITRVPTDFYHEGYIDVVDFDSNDKLSLDGQRLISIGGDQYRTENESFSKITLYGTSTNPTYFKVETKDGLELYYGNTDDSRVEAQGTSYVYAWNLNQVKDKNGNFYSVTYTETTSTGEIYPASINYSCYGSTAGDYTVKFGYENRSVPIKTYINGSQVMINKLLDTINIKYGTSVVGRYKLVYTNSKLGEIIKFGKNNTRLNSTFVNWGSTNVGLAESNKITLPSAAGRYRYTGDFNGDGKTDLVLIDSATLTMSLYLADQTGSLQFQSSQSLPANFKSRQVYPGDYNGDGLEDLLVLRLIGGYYYLSFLISNGNSFTEIDYPYAFSSSSCTIILEISTATGKLDLMVRGSGIYNCAIDEFTFHQEEGFHMHLLGQCNITWGSGLHGQDKRSPFDMNGDGKTELMVLDATGSRFYGLLFQPLPISELGSRNAFPPLPTVLPRAPALLLPHPTTSGRIPFPIEPCAPPCSDFTRARQMCSGGPENRYMRPAMAACREPGCESPGPNGSNRCGRPPFSAWARTWPACCPAAAERSAGREPVQSLHQQVRAHRGQPPAQVDGVLFGPISVSAFSSMSAGVEPRVDAHGGDAGARFPIDDGPLDGAAPRYLGSSEACTLRMPSGAISMMACGMIWP